MWMDMEEFGELVRCTARERGIECDDMSFQFDCYVHHDSSSSHVITIVDPVAIEDTPMGRRIQKHTDEGIGYRSVCGEFEEEVIAKLIVALLIELRDKNS